MYEFLNIVFGWLADLTCPLYYFGSNYGEIDNPIVSFIKVLVMAPFLIVVTFIPIWWIIKLIVWPLFVFSDEI